MSMEQEERDAREALPEIAGYRLLRVLGTGGMSTVYLAKQLSLGREVAIKVMRPETLTDEVSRRRFENEARTIARLDHPHIVGIYEVGRTRDGLPYYAMPCLMRGHLGQRDFTQDQERVRAIVHALLSALGYAHARGVVHRDVKAENVLFDDGERPLLADFGIALRRGYGSRVTTAGLAVGSTAYMAPEQARGEAVDFRADLYSLGVLTWELLTGQLPFNAGDALSMAVMHAQDPIPRLPPQLRHWQRFIDRAMAKSPDKRFRDAKQMAAALDAVPRRQARPPSRLSLRGVVAGVRRLPRPVWIAALLVLAAGIGFASRQSREPDAPRFFRAAGDETGRALPTPGAQPNRAVIANPEAAMLRAAPEAAAERWIAAAERQIKAGRLTAPAGDNAADSLVTAWQADAGDQRLVPAIGRLIEALGARARQRLENDDVPGARAQFEHALKLAERTQQSGHPALAKVRTDLQRTLDARIDRAAAKFDRDAALQAAEAGQRLGLDRAAVTAMRARAQKIPGHGERIGAGDPLPMVLVRRDAFAFAAAATPVSRQAYAAFAQATGRPAALCRERTSLLRLVKPRDWQDPGFEQRGGDPVVCVSWQDADAYARWLSTRGKHRYRLPTAGEARLLTPAGGAKPVAEWNVDCAGGCAKRTVSGRSWRGGSGARDADRGYDDVGFRVVRDL